MFVQLLNSFTVVMMIFFYVVCVRMRVPLENTDVISMCPASFVHGKIASNYLAQLESNLPDCYDYRLHHH